MSLADWNEKRLRLALENVIGQRVPNEEMDEFIKIFMRNRAADPIAFDQRLNHFLLSMDPLFSQRLEDIPENRTQHALQVIALQAMAGAINQVPTLH